MKELSQESTVPMVSGTLSTSQESRFHPGPFPAIELANVRTDSAVESAYFLLNS